MDITVQELKEKKEKNEEFVLIDVREPNEREAFHLGGQLVPIGQFPAAIAEFKGHESDEVIVYCRSGRRSGIVQHMMQEAGFENVRNLEGGILAWIELFGKDEPGD